MNPLLNNSGSLTYSLLNLPTDNNTIDQIDRLFRDQSLNTNSKSPPNKQKQPEPMP